MRICFYDQQSAYFVNNQIMTDWKDGVKTKYKIMNLDDHKFLIYGTVHCILFSLKKKWKWKIKIRQQQEKEERLYSQLFLIIVYIFHWLNSLQE